MPSSTKKEEEEEEEKVDQSMSICALPGKSTRDTTTFDFRKYIHNNFFFHKSAIHFLIDITIQTANCNPLSIVK